jgi:pimeloyl-ACP methyl ester carboxylesterase
MAARRLLRAAGWCAASLLGLGLGSIATAATAATPCGPASLAVGRNSLWAHAQGAGALTVVFEAGFGNDSTVWAGIEPRVRAMGVRTLVYDRAGLGRSVIDTEAPYSLDNDVRLLREVLARCAVDGPVVFVAHSYGGAIALKAAQGDGRFKGLVLLDALVPGVWTDHEVEKNLSAMRPQFDDIRKQAPDLAKVAIPWAEAMPQTARELNALTVAESLPIIEIAAENGQTDPDSAKTWRSAQLAFTAGHPSRTFVLAKGSSHKVMADQPDLVVEAIRTMVDRVRSAP